MLSPEVEIAIESYTNSMEPTPPAIVTADVKAALEQMLAEQPDLSVESTIAKLFTASVAI